ncbi:mRNA-decapping enzyme 1A [Thalassophryne amazonica]|uniref:mRNA-decapping enzyme 1A n=1 Tax=Thalassophryne amazonica TaxID=390379 RepID=UPI00147091E3|nr:mRNA-decapping enzyme 1A [Thalassophryne amazonica]
MESANAGRNMSLAALQRQDPYINKLLDVTGQVALYNFNSEANEWEKTEIEGTLFVYARSASPHHGFTIMNRLSTENLVEPINKDLEFQLQDPFLLYRNGNLGIYSIWFYDKRDCQRIAQLMVKIVKQEADQARRDSPQRAEPGRTNGVAEPRSVDILELLSKAKEEYQKAQTGETDASVAADTNVKAAVSVAENAHSTSQPGKSSHTIVKQITVEELFGSSLPKDPYLPGMPHQNNSGSDPTVIYLPNQKYPPLAHQNTLLSPNLTGPDPGSNQRCQTLGLLTGPYTLQPSPVLHSVGPRSDPHPLCSVSPLMVPPTQPEPGTAASPASKAYLGQEILSTLKPGLLPAVNPDLHKPILTPNLLPSTLVPPQSFQEPVGKNFLQHGKDVDVYSQASSLIRPMSAVVTSAGLPVPGSEVSMLLSPSAFQHHSINKTAAVLPPPSSEPSPCSSSSSSSTDPLKAPCSKTQLQEALIHLIKNDPDFLSTIHDVYLQTLSKDFGSMKL